MERTGEPDELPAMEIEKEEIIQAPSSTTKAGSTDSNFSTSGDLLSLDNIMLDEESSGDMKSPFKDIDQHDIPFDDEEEILKGEGLFLDDESFLDVEKNVADELEAISYWLKELERQRTSTTERNMMEIFDEFKKGVDEKIGKEDYDTRYNLGIAYKEMGLFEELIHQFLISSKHKEKFFDSAGLLGMCFREKGMFDEAVGWFDKALELEGRESEEYIALKYELVLTFRLKEDPESAKKILEEILSENPKYRNAPELYEEIKKYV